MSDEPVPEDSPSPPPVGGARGTSPPEAPVGGTDEKGDAPSAGPTLRGGADTDSFDAEAYEAGRRNLRPPDGTVISGGQGQSVQIGNRFYYQGRRSAAPTPGPVRPEQLAAIRDRYVQVPGYQQMLDDLQERRLMVLVGPTGSGRSTTALHLLDELADGAVSRLDPHTDLRTLDHDALGREHGYLGELGELGATTAPPTEAQADRLADLLDRQKSFCVLVSPSTPSLLRAFAAYRSDCAAPPAEELLARHVDARLRSDDPPGTAQRLSDLARTQPLQDALGPQPRPSQVAGFAGLLVAHARGELTVDEVERGTSAFLERRVSDWFAALREPSRRDATDRMLRLAALRLALAVFDGLPRHVVVSAGEELGALLIQTGSPRLTPGRPLVVDDDPTLLAALDAEIAEDGIRYGGISVPAQIFRYRNRRTPATVVTHVWQNHHNLRPPIVDWLNRLSVDPQPAIRQRAAQAAGLMCSVDFSHSFPMLVEPAALAQPKGSKRAADPSDVEPDEPDEPDDDRDESWRLRRGFAAMALDQAALDDRVVKAVDAALRRWRRSADPALRWTAARTFGYDIGLRSVEKTLDELRVIGTPQELVDVAELPPGERAQVWELVWVAGLGIARLFANGARHPVLAQLTEWLGHPRQSMRVLAQQAVVITAELKMSVLVERASAASPSGDVCTAPAGRERWPLLLGLVAEDRSLAAPTVDILHRTLRGPAGELVTDSISTWIGFVQNDTAALEAFIGLLPLLARDEWERGRLRHIVRRRTSRWADPLKPDVAARLEAAITDVSRRRV